ncbi:MAG: hypothetical protein IJ368_00005 [Oscillospiraceae bacterium]|nr:hypothetical protein [Oscillospiraceae bacterium]
MEVFIGFIIVLVIMLCLGVEIGFIASVAAAAVGLVIVLIFAFFVYSAVLLALSEKAEGNYSHTEKNSRGFESAFYIVDGEAMPNAFPKEVVFSRLLYRSENTVKLRLVRKKKLVFDMNAQITTIVGLVFFTVHIAAALILLINHF